MVINSENCAKSTQTEQEKRNINISGDNVDILNDLLDGITTDFDEISNKLKDVSRKINDSRQKMENPKSKTQNQTSTTEETSIDEIRKDLEDFYEFCRQNNLSSDDIAQICKPLSQEIKKHAKIKTKTLIIIIISCSLLVICAIYGLETLTWHLSALGRLFLVSLQPFWNWETLKHEKCAIGKVNPEIDDILTQDCAFCEYVNTIDVADAFNPELIYENYIKVQKPVILENGMENWPHKETNNSILDLILEDKVLPKSFPCKFSSNLYNGNGNLYEATKWHKNHNVYFVHFQFCEMTAVKAFRKYFPRPNFLVPEIYPIQYSWVITNKNYKIEKFKVLSFNENVMIMGQISGKTEVMLQTDNCLEDCVSLRISLSKGEALIFTNHWIFSYLPHPEGENFAVILETKL